MTKKLKTTLSAIVAATLAAAAGNGVTAPTTWVTVDALGRNVASADSGANIKNPADTSVVGMFYYVWHGQHGAETKDLTKLLNENPENPKFGPWGAFHWGGEPWLSYYEGGDRFVVAKHMQWLMDAGVDFYFFDATNAVYYPKQVQAVMSEIDRRQALGLKTPKLVFTVNSAPAKTIQGIYDTFYSKPEYDKYWYEWQNKPLILANISACAELPEKVKSRFTWRFSWAWMQGKNPNEWAWLETYPQQPGWTVGANGEKVIEQMSVSTAQHPSTGIGKSYHNGYEPPVDKYGLCKETPYGLYFQEQMKRAHEVHAPLLMVTQWNEWMAMRFCTAGGTCVRPGGFEPKPTESFFVDVYNQEFNRDIEPSKEPLIRDNYYMLFCSEMRKYLGVDPIPVPKAQKSIKVKGSFAQWNDVKPEYADEPGDTRFTSATGQSRSSLLRPSNDIVLAKVASDKRNTYFYVKTADKFVEAIDSTLWMTLLVNVDCDYATGWSGYDFMVTAKDGVMSLKRYDGSQWVVVKALKWSCGENEMMVEVPKKLLGINGFSDFDFKWIDNVPVDLADVMLFYSDGDAAPNTRFNYRFKGSALR